jgi:hypothetical protein
MNVHICLTSLFACLALLVPSVVARDDETEWGNLTATFLYDGEPPEPKAIDVDKDAAAFKLPLFDQSLLVEPKTKGIANVVVWLYVMRDAKLPPIHPSYKELAKRDVTLTYHNGQIDPHISLVRINQKLVLNNTDKVAYNPKMDFFYNLGNSDLIRAETRLSKVYTKKELSPGPVTCTIHPWIEDYILIQDHPYFAVSNSAGKLHIDNLPVGTHTFRIWHERRGLITEAKVNGGLTHQGKFTIDIKPGDNDLGEIKLTPDRRE